MGFNERKMKTNFIKICRIQKKLCISEKNKSLSKYMGKYKYIKISNLNFHFGKIEKEQQIKPKGNKRKKESQKSCKNHK